MPAPIRRGYGLEPGTNSLPYMQANGMQHSSSLSYGVVRKAFDCPYKLHFLLGDTDSLQDPQRMVPTSRASARPLKERAPVRKGPLGQKRQRTQEKTLSRSERATR